MNHLLRRLLSHRRLSLSKRIMVVCVIVILVVSMNKQTILSPSHSRNGRNTNQPNANLTTQQRRVLLAFHYEEQLTMATNNLLQLTALAAFGGRQVVVPFVSDSFFYGTATDKINRTLALYYNITALNNTLRSHGHATMISWKEFQSICKGRLDVLVHLDYTALSKTTTYSAARPFVPGKSGEKMIQGIKIGTTICVNAFALDSVARFENEAVNNLPCVGIFQWKGNSKDRTYRAQFDLKSVVNRVLSHHDTNVLLSPKLLDIARDFIAQNLGSLFISVHIRAEKILKKQGGLSLCKKCIQSLTAHVQKIMYVKALPVFLATDFSEFGSSSYTLAKVAHKIAPSLMEILSPLKAITFQPSKYKLSDRGVVATEEMNILASGGDLVVLGGGSFQGWIISQFLYKNGHDRAKVEHIACY